MKVDSNNTFTHSQWTSTSLNWKPELISAILQTKNFFLFVEVPIFLIWYGCHESSGKFKDKYAILTVLFKAREVSIFATLDEEHNTALRLHCIHMCQKKWPSHTPLSLRSQKTGFLDYGRTWWDKEGSFYSLVDSPFIKHQKTAIFTISGRIPAWVIWVTRGYARVIHTMWQWYQSRPGGTGLVPVQTRY